MKTTTKTKTTEPTAQPNQGLGDHDIRTITLSCRAPDAKAVYVAGTFNGWSPTATQMNLRMPQGEWRVDFPAPPGRHEYKFVVDGQWCCEPGDKDVPHEGQGCCQNAFGSTNRVLE
jgi:1,4-alpha-glucan branching enzyme